MARAGWKSPRSPCRRLRKVVFLLVGSVVLHCQHSNVACFIATFCTALHRGHLTAGSLVGRRSMITMPMG